MTRIALKELNMKSRAEVLCFLKRLWREERTPCPICGNELEPLHKKAKKDNNDWQCKSCEKVYRTISLLYELNEQMPI